MSSHQYVYVMHRLSKAWPGGKEVLKNISLSFLPGAKIGVLGLNGAGKSTLLKIMAGIDTDFNGDAWAADGIKIGYLAQEPELDESMDVAGNVLSGLGEAKELMDRFNAVSARFAEELTDDEMNEVIAEQAELQEKIDAIDGWDMERKAEIAMDALRVPDGSADVTRLSGGEKRRVALCKLLLSAPDMLLLDEPTNHLDAESVAWLQRFLHDFPGTVVTITHDRYFLDEVAGWILELDRGAGIPYEGNYSGWLEQKQKRLEQEGKAEDARVKSLSRELGWVRAAPKARQAKSKARISAYEKMLAEENDRQIDTAKIHIPAGPRLGDVVINAQGLSKGFGDRLLIDDLSFRLPPGGIVGVIGPNGAGKTTFMDIVTGKTRPDAGDVRWGEKGVSLVRKSEAQIAQLGIGRKFQKPTVFETQSVYDNLMMALANSRNPFSVLSYKRSRGDDDKIEDLAGQINLMEQLDVLAGALSHGQKQWLEIGMLLAQDPKLLLIDEPAAGMTAPERAVTVKLLKELAVSRAVVVVEHDMEFIRQLECRITVLHEGSVLAEGQIDFVMQNQDVIDVYLGR
ncbi:MAG TPA: energy-dependent translational throttle protein EttA [Alphaproteobacteria bacterium]|nr:energy-dependent translational throttle protein EttA [Alphaproteobacteria bacterium]